MNLLLQGLVAFLATYGLVVLLAGWGQTLRAWRRSKQPPAVSLLLLVRDREAVIEGIVQDLLALDYLAAGASPNLELIIVDDRSQDGTPRLLDELAQVNPLLRVVRLPEGAAPGQAAVEVGLFLCRSPVTLVLDARGTVSPGVLLGAAEYLLGRRPRPERQKALSV